MPKLPDASTAPQSPPLKPHWWWHDDDYVANDTWNWLAVAETVVAFCLYFWIASIASWPWLTTVSFIAVPLLLLRSEASIQRGVTLLNAATEDRDLTRTEQWAVGLVAALISAGLAYLASDFVAQKWLTELSGWALFWRSFVIGAVAVAGAGAGAVAVAGAVVVTGAGAGAGAVLIMPGFVLGLCIMGLAIRVRATLTWPHLKEGVRAFSHNWFETVLVSNIRHAPGLLPRAGSVNTSFNVATLIQIKRDGAIDVYVYGMLAIAFTLVATVYRWNIKANSWIWWPLYLLLRRPIQWEKHPLAPAGAPSEQRRTNSASWSNGRIFSALGITIGVLLGYLIYPHIPKDLQALQHGWVAVLNAYTPSNWQSLRYWLAVALLIALCNQLFCTFKMSTQYQEQLAKSEAHQKMTPDVEAGFDSTANQLVRSRWFAFAFFLLLVYAVAIKFAIQLWPNTWGNVVWDWLKAIL
jgi:hypothetical protein